MWSPGIQHSPPPTRQSPAGRESPSMKDVPGMWAPGGTPGSDKKDYRPIKPEAFKPPPEKKHHIVSHVYFMKSSSGLIMFTS